MRSKQLIFTILLLSTALFATAQKFVWDLKLDSRFDNREYKSEINWPQTLFGARITPQIGIGWGHDNYIKVGSDLMADFGAKSFDTKPTFLVYYGYESRQFDIYAGVFPRDKMQGNYSNAFFSDSVRFYDADLEGLLMHYRKGKFFAEFGCDWNSKLDSCTREKFMLFSSAQFTTKIFNAGFNFAMYHHAGTTQVDGVVDNVLLNPYVCGDFKSLLPFDVLYLRIGFLQAFQNDRRYVGEYVSPYGSLIELGIEKWGLGIYNATYQGMNLMPYYEQYSSGLYFGEPFFRTREHMYNRLEIYWKPLRRKDMNLYIGSVHHFDGKSWGWQQVVQFTVTLGDKMFRKKPE